MFERILYPTDGSEPAREAFEYALDVADHHGAELHVLSVADTTRDSLVRIRGDVVDALERAGQRAVTEAADRAGEHGVEAVTAVRQGRPDAEILSYAEQVDAGLVMLPTRGRGVVEETLFGSVAQQVLRQATRPVLTVRPGTDPGAHHPYRRVLVPTDGSDPADAAVETGAVVARAYDARLDLLSVVNLASLGADIRSEMQADTLENHAHDVVEEAVAAAEAAGVGSVSGFVEHAPAVHRAVLGHVEAHGTDLVVLGTHGRGAVDRLLLGSVAGKLVRTAPVPVMTVRGAVADDLEE
jgi:nucleotide-binding universal stress UspA family protein